MGGEKRSMLRKGQFIVVGNEKRNKLRKGPFIVVGGEQTRDLIKGSFIVVVGEISSKWAFSDTFSSAGANNEFIRSDN